MMNTNPQDQSNYRARRNSSPEEDQMPNAARHCLVRKQSSKPTQQHATHTKFCWVRKAENISPVWKMSTDSPLGNTQPSNIMTKQCHLLLETWSVYIQVGLSTQEHSLKMSQGKTKKLGQRTFTLTTVQASRKIRLSFKAENRQRKECQRVAKLLTLPI